MVAFRLEQVYPERKSCTMNPINIKMNTVSDSTNLKRQLSRFWRRFPVNLYRIGLGSWLGYLPLLILTTRKTTTSGPRHTPLEYRRHGSRMYVISPDPDTARWFAHIKEQTCATIRIGDKKQVVKATIVTDEAEAVRVLFLFRLNIPRPLRWITWSARKQDEIRPQALKQTARRYAVVRLENSPEPLNEVLLPPVEADRVWILVVAVGAIVLWAGMNRRKR